MDSGWSQRCRTGSSVASLAATAFDGLLGVGGTGCVFSERSRLQDASSRALIKLLFGEMATDRSTAERFRREAEAVRAINHPNIVKIIDDRPCRPPACRTWSWSSSTARRCKTIIEERGPPHPCSAP